ncbi:hypothetical protein RJT34_25449 [Clitoria ternatea]|uniref:Transmembrane protein n=1 Tax=Clitoria ternatea TaxID=43366 RepID=A0AAN9FQ01_CLITE
MEEVRWQDASVAASRGAGGRYSLLIFLLFLFIFVVVSSFHPYFVFGSFSSESGSSYCHHSFLFSLLLLLVCYSGILEIGFPPIFSSTSSSSFFHVFESIFRIVNRRKSRKFQNPITPQPLNNEREYHNGY